MSSIGGFKVGIFSFFALFTTFSWDIFYNDLAKDIKEEKKLEANQKEVKEDIL